MVENGGKKMNHQKNAMKIGQIAQLLDAEYTIFDRMKIKKETIKRIGYASLIYISIMILFAILF